MWKCPWARWFPTLHTLVTIETRLHSTAEEGGNVPTVDEIVEFGKEVMGGDK